MRDIAERLAEIEARLNLVNDGGPGIDHDHLGTAINMVKKDLPDILAVAKGVLALAEKWDDLATRAHGRNDLARAELREWSADDLRAVVRKGLGL